MNRCRIGHVDAYLAAQYGKAPVAVDGFPPDLVATFVEAQTAMNPVAQRIGFARVGNRRKVPADHVASTAVVDRKRIRLLATADQLVLVSAIVGNCPTVDVRKIVDGNVAIAKGKRIGHKDDRLMLVDVKRAVDVYGNVDVKPFPDNRLFLRESRLSKQRADAEKETKGRERDESYSEPESPSTPKSGTHSCSSLEVRSRMYRHRFFGECTHLPQE